MRKASKMKAVIIAGSSRNDGNTSQAVATLQALTGFETLILSDYKINHYDYKNANKTDDYLPLMRRIIEQYDTLIFATPVYWYAMSGILKVFFDRLTGLLTIEKDLGRLLCGKSMAVISCSAGDNLGDSFWLPFRETARYFEMNYLGDLHLENKKPINIDLKLFAESIAIEHEKIS